MEKVGEAKSAAAFIMGPPPPPPAEEEEDEMVEDVWFSGLVEAEAAEEEEEGGPPPSPPLVVEEGGGMLPSGSVAPPPAAAALDRWTLSSPWSISLLLVGAWGGLGLVLVACSGGLGESCVNEVGLFYSAGRHAACSRSGGRGEPGSEWVTRGLQRGRGEPSWRVRGVGVRAVGCLCVPGHVDTTHTTRFLLR